MKNSTLWEEKSNFSLGLLLHTQLVELFEQYPCITCFSHDEEGVYFLHGEDFLHIHYNQIESIVSETDKVTITLGNGAIYTVALSQDRVRITLPHRNPTKR